MKAHKMKVTIPEHHQVEIHLPEDFPAGPAEVIVLADSGGDRVARESQQQMRRALQKLQAIQWTPEEERILDEFEEFQRRHPIDFSSLTEEEP